MSTLTVQNKQGSSSSSNTINVASGHIIHQPGMTLQVLQATQEGGPATTSNSYVSTGLFKAITPKFASSKILVHFCVVMIIHHHNNQEN